jgi:hypothetical protein
MVKLKVLVGCEFSGIVRDAFAALGHDAMSCDLEPTERPGQHYQGSLFDVIDYPWDLAIFHPPCTHLSVSGSRHFEAKKINGLQQSAVSFFMKIVRNSEHIPMTAIENPVSIMSTMYKKPTIIHPWQFGHMETKTTCLWLKNLQPLVPTNIVKDEMLNLPKYMMNRIHYMSPGENRAKERSRTYQGIADAMAYQWGKEINNEQPILSHG